MCQCCDVSWGADTAESPQPAPRTESASPPARLLAALRGALHLDFTGFWPPAGRSSGPGPWEGSLLAQRASLTPGLAGPGTLGPEDEPPDSQLAGGCGAVQEAMGVCVCGRRGGAPRPSRRGPSGTGVRLGQGPGCAGGGVVSAPSRQRVLPQVFPCMRPLRRGREMHLGLTPCPVGTVERLEKSGCSRAGAGQVNPSPREPSFRSAVVVTFASHVSPGLRGPGLSRVPAVGPGRSCWLRSAVGSSSCRFQCCGHQSPKDTQTTRTQ